MADSYVTYTGDGSTTVYTFSFPYLDADHIHCYIDGDETTFFSVTATGEVTFDSAPALASTVQIARETPRDEQLTVFTDTSVLLESDLNTAELQLLYLVQEAYDNLNLAAADAAETAEAAAEAAAAIALSAGGGEYVFSSATTNSDPGVGYIKFDNATLASATKLYISETDANGSVISGVISAWDDSTSTVKGTLRVIKRSDPTLYAVFNVTGTNTDNGGWDTVNLTYLENTGTFHNLDEVSLQFIAKGDVGSLADGDKGDIVVTGTGGTWTIDSSVVTYAKMQNVSATDKLLGRSTAGAGVIEEITCTAAGRALIDDASASVQRSTLGLGTAAQLDTGTSGATIPVLNAANTWSAIQSLLGLITPRTTVTIAAGVITATNSCHTVDTEASAATDDLDTITAGGLGQWLVLRANSAARTVVVKNGTGNIVLHSGDYTMSATDRFIILMYDTGLAKWVELARAARVGAAVQVVNTETGAVSSGSTQIPGDDTIPQNTEGDQVMTLAITPTSSTNKLKIEVVVQCAVSGAGTAVAALFQDTTANALAAMPARIDTAGGMTTISFTHFMTAGTTSSTTFKVRLGATSALTCTFNGTGGGRIFGGVMASSITITEIKV